MRNSARKRAHNRSQNTRLGSLEKRFLQLLGTGKKDEAAKAYQDVSSALDKAAKTGNVHKSRASRKKSRLAIQLNKMK
jgi:small subunit ribosomal protein S20